MKSNVRRQDSLPYKDNTHLPQEARQTGSPPSESIAKQQPSPSSLHPNGSTVRQAANDRSSEALPRYHLIPLSEVIKRVSLQRTSIYAMILADTFPAPLKVGRASRWLDRDVSQWIQSLVDQRNLAKGSNRS